MERGLSGDRRLFLLGFLSPGRWDDLWHLLIGQVRQAGEHVAEGGVRFNPTAAATLDDGVNDCAALTGVGFADEQPVLFSEGGGANGVLDEIIVQFNATSLRKTCSVDHWPR